ncbi:MAG: DNA replication/repair protein RecF [Bacteroidota bacterium]
MRLERLVLRDFRNYEHAEVFFTPTVNVFVGRNAQGKTNLLEAIYLIAMGRSFRASGEDELIRHEKENFHLNGDFLGDQDQRLVIEYGAGSQGRLVRLNGVPLRRAQELFGRVRVVLFSPDDLQMVKGGPEFRRAFLDLQIAQSSPAYRFVLYHYQRLLRQRNEALRRVGEGRTGAAELNVWDEGLIKRGMELTKRRIDALRTLGPLISSYHQRLANGEETIVLRYKLGGRIPAEPGLDIEVYLREEIARRRAEEISRGLTLVGPHRDDIELGFPSGHGVRTFGSQGQQRTAALAMKMAAVDFLRDATAENPIILLDDVLSEFDRTRQRALLDLAMEGSQTIITAADEHAVRLHRPHQVFLVEGGKIATGGMR